MVTLAEAFRAELRAGSTDAIKRVRFVAQTTRDPRVRREAIEYLAQVRRV